jgi:hypothetical protein
MEREGERGTSFLEENDWRSMRSYQDLERSGLGSCD